MSDTVIYEQDGGVATITLNRPEAMNSLTLEMKEALAAAVRRARDDAAVRAVLLTGSGRAFCAGQDLREHAANLEAGRGLAGTVRDHYNPIISDLVEMPKPVVAAVNGVAAGAGASLAFACDLRIASERASFALAFAAIGLAPDSGASWSLQNLVGRAAATEILLLGEPLKAPRALELGLLTRVVPGEELAAVAGELVAKLAAGPTVAYGAIKQAVEFAATAGLRDALEREAELQEKCAETTDHKTATAAFLRKEAPTFEGR
ncbi:MAG: enoyl-CoA hydratase [Streptosporangiales bacterium]|nr:enoyl-CoA hydratase [Streptosporangiales bacterium]